MPARRRTFVALTVLLAGSGVLATPVALTTATASTAVHLRPHAKHRHHAARTTTGTRPTRPRPTATPSPSPSTSLSPTTTSAPAPSPTTTTSAPAPSPTPSPSVTPPSPYTVRTDWAGAVLDQLNAERAQNGLAPLRLSSALTTSAHRHNVAMADANTLSHQLGGEAGLGSRVTAAGYSWSACGENIAWNSRRTREGVLALETAMYGETPPNDGHRRNILSTSFVDVGIDVVDDGVHGKVWLTTDFGRPR